MEPLTPYDTGELYNSTFIQPKAKLKTWFGLNIEYAAYQHEGGDGVRVIRNRPAGGETYFMLKTLNTNNKKYQKLLADNLL